ncbi:unnamed protein product [Mytilus edulis]|uniref:Uncharacterized protein n=1 Tax=Mytilus edulis TaxID=6550 RepID=A0A8S3RK43_MYTED|nr:unnamed protein product [Mytilus edulis]
MAAGTHPYDLPAGKEYHIFIACSGEDSEKGRCLMEQLESRYPFRCVYHERDFLAGAIVDNMRDFMDKSVKCLLLISQIEEMCSDTTEALNSYSGMKCYGLFTMRRMCIGMLIASVVFGVLVVGIYGIYVVAKKEVFNGMIIWIPIMVGMLAVPFFYLVFVGAVGKKKSKCLIFYDNLPLGIFQYWTQRTVPQIVVIRYDTNPCKEFVLLYLQTKYKNIPDITIEAYQTNIQPHSHSYGMI